MPKSPRLGVVTLLLCLAAPAAADEPRPGSVLVFPAHHTDATRITCIAVTNTSPSQSVNALFRYVTSGEDLFTSNASRDCKELYRAELLTPSDTVAVTTNCHAAGGGDAHGYLIVSAKSTLTGQSADLDYLVGHALIFDSAPGFGGVITYLPASYAGLSGDGQPTDADFDGRLDFDGIEYEQLPDDLYIDSFLGLGGSRLSLINLTGDNDATVSVQFYIFNDNERAFSATFSFQCWFEQPLTSISAAFSEGFLLANLPNDPGEIDIDCDGIQDVESGWAQVSGLSAFGNFSSVSNPPLLGSLTGVATSLEGGRLLWGSNARSSGQF